MYGLPGIPFPHPEPYPPQQQHDWLSEARAAYDQGDGERAAEAQAAALIDIAISLRIIARRSR